MKAIAIDIDNVLNDFSETLKDTIFDYKDSYGLSREEFTHYLAVIKRNAFHESKFLTTKFSDFRYRIHEQCYRLSRPKPDGVEFIRWLTDNHWQVVICTKRDLRLTGDCTKQWLAVNHIPYDYLCMALNKVVFCYLWQVPYLIDDDIFNIMYGEEFGIKVYYPRLPKHNLVFPDTAKEFARFEEIKKWIQE